MNDLAICDAVGADIPALSRLHVTRWNATHRGGRSGGPTYELRERQWREAFSHPDGSWFCLVIERFDGALVGFGARLRGSKHLVYPYWCLVMVVVGVAALWGLSAIGGFGRTSGRSSLWGLLIVPYPIGWLAGRIGGVRVLGEARGVA
jgi:hypothetical protein